MALNRQTLISNNQEWTENRRYKVNSVVLHSGVVYQNFTGSNTNPSLLQDWFPVNLTPEPVTEKFKQSIIWDGITPPTPSFEIPAGKIISVVHIDRSILYADEFEQIGTVLTISIPVDAGSKITFFE